MKQGAYQLFLAGSIYFCFLATTNPTQAQIVPDATLPVNSTVKFRDNISTIEDGTRAGNNLFHSFEQFSVVTGNTAFFNNALDIQNIITRVTGSSVSNINGLIQARGTANLFLLNPNGIIFGPNARINIGGSFLASTANSLNFADGIQFTAKAGQTTPLLTVSVPIGLQYGGTAGGISVQQSHLEVRTGKTLALIGGDVRLDGGSLETLGGRVELGAVAEAGTVSLDLNGKNLRLTFPDGLVRTDIFLTNGVSVDVRTGFSVITGSPVSLNTIELGDDGSIAINARNLYVLEGSELKAGIRTLPAAVLRLVTQANGLDILTDLPFIKGADFRAFFAGIGGLGTDGIQAGNITLNATEATTIRQSNITNVVEHYSPGNGGNINIQAGSITLSDRAQLISTTNGLGNAGSISVQANDSISFANSFIASTIGAGADGNGGNLIIKGGSLSVTGGTQLEVSNGSGSGQIGNVNIDVHETVDFDASVVKSTSLPNLVAEGGNINVEAGSLLLTNGSSLSTLITAARAEDAGKIYINTHETVSLDNSSIFTQVFGGVGQITINTRSLFLTNGSQISTNLLGGVVSRSGDIQVNASDSVSISGGGLFATSNSRLGNAGAIFIDTRTFRLSDSGVLDARTESNAFIESEILGGGLIIVNANTFELTSGGRVQTTTSKGGRAGNIMLNISERVMLEGSASGLFANTDKNSTGNGGSIFMDSRQVIIRDGAGIAVSSDGKGSTGSVQIQADSVTLDRGGFLSATTASGDRGNIIIQSQNLQLRRNSNIITNASGSANGGNITIDTGVVAALENSDIRANAIRGQGGNIQINTQGIFRSPDSDIDASSQLGIDGVVTLNTPGIDPASGLLELPETPADPQQIAQGCPTDKNSRFTVTGRGGLPPNPGESLRTDGTVVNWVTLEPQEQGSRGAGVRGRVLTEDSRLDGEYQILDGEYQRLDGEYQILGSESSKLSTQHSAPSTEIVEAQGWAIDANGKVVLTADAPTVTPHSSRQRLSVCW